MQFRVTTRQELSPSLLADPAFSPDPHSNPYFASNGEPAWASSPPVGHPVLKRRNPRQTSIFAHPLPADDVAFQLIQPPNSPDIPPSATQTASSLPFLNNTGPPSARAAPEAEALKQPVVFSISSNSKTPRPPSPPPPPILEQGKEQKKKKRLMPFLSRRKSSNPPVPAAAPSSLKVQDTQAQTQAAARGDVTQRSQPVPGRIPSEPSPMNQNGDPRPATLSRPPTSGVSTPTARSVITTRSGVPSQNVSARTQDLDRIDELDDTNPWGISLHHRGPYEAAVQALRNANNSMSLGQGSNMLNGYRQGPQAQENVYIPPQVPMGVSLNLSPGQILPRNFALPQSRYPRRQATIDSLPQRMPPSYMASPPALRRQSQPPQPMSAFPNPHPAIPILSHVHDPSPSAPVPEPPPPPPQAHREPEPIQPELKADKSDVLPFDIGMAMLRSEVSEVSESSNPSIYVQPETRHGSDFDPYDPIHLENAHSRTPSPLVHEPFLEISREPTPDPLPERLIPQPTIFRKSPDHPDILRPGSNKQVSNNMPPAAQVDSISLPTKQWPSAQTQDQSQSRNHSPFPPISSTSCLNVDRNESTVSLLNTSVVADANPFPTDSANPTQLPKSERSGPQIPMTREIRDQASLRLPTVQDHDARSTNQSISTYTSSQMRSGRPPPHRRVPKHLVMPAPLNPATNNPARFLPTQTQQTLPPSQFGPTRVQVQIRAQSHVPYPSGPQMFAPDPVSQEKQIASGGKLRKKLSTRLLPQKVTNTPPAPIVSNVSFAPPVIGYGPPPSFGKELGPNPSKISARRLSKRRTDL